MAHAGMVYILMAYKAMALIVMAYIVMAYIVLASDSSCRVCMPHAACCTYGLASVRHVGCELVLAYKIMA